MKSTRPAISYAGGAAILLLLLAAASVYELYQQENAPKAAIAISTSNCSTVSYEVTNDDSRILQGWGVKVIVTPSDTQINVNPEYAGVAALAPNGSVNGTVSLNFDNGAPVGTYQVSANLVNGTDVIATSNSVPCTLK